jgi:hypothetical protein
VVSAQSGEITAGHLQALDALRLNPHAMELRAISRGRRSTVTEEAPRLASLDPTTEQIIDGNRFVDHS